MHYWVILNSNKFIARRTSWSNLFPYLAVLRQCMNLLLIASCQEPVNLTFSCAKPQRSVILQGRLRKLVVSWNLFPDLFPNQSRKESITSSKNLIRAFKGLPKISRCGFKSPRVCITMDVSHSVEVSIFDFVIKMMFLTLSFR